jgi:uncharacterized protein (TIGR03437 family)
VLFAIDTLNRIARVNVATAESVDIVPPTPYLTSTAAQVSRGSVTTISGSGLAADPQTAQPPFPLSLAGVELRVSGIAVPIAGVSATSVSYPATWDLPDDRVDVEVWVSSAGMSPFVPGFEVTTAAPAFYSSSGGNGPAMLVAVHEDFSALISTLSPARPGEYIHVYAKDLGPVIPAPVAGLSAPLNFLSQLAVPVSCTLGLDAGPSPVPVSIPFAGLAPGFLNLFQLNIRMPDSFQGSLSHLLCRIGYASVNHLAGGFLATGTL